MTIKELILAQCKVQGVPDKYAERIEKLSAITEEKDGNIIAAVKSFKENILPVIVDSEKAAADAVKEYEKKHGLQDGKLVKTSTEDDTDEDDETEIDIEGMDDKKRAFFKKQSKNISDLTDLVTNLVKTQKSTSTLESVKLKLKGKIEDKFLEKYAKRVNIEAEDIDAEVDNIVKEFNDDKQAFINEAIASGSYQPAEGSTAGDKTVEEWTKIMEGGDDKGKVAGVVDLGI